MHIKRWGQKCKGAKARVWSCEGEGATVVLLLRNFVLLPSHLRASPRILALSLLNLCTFALKAKVQRSKDLIGTAKVFGELTELELFISQLTSLKSSDGVWTQIDVLARFEYSIVFIFQTYLTYLISVIKRKSIPSLESFHLKNFLHNIGEVVLTRWLVVLERWHVVHILLDIVGPVLQTTVGQTVFLPR